MRKLLASIVQVEPGEGQKLALSFLHFFFILLAYLLLKPVRSSLLIFHQGSSSLPVVYFITAAVLTGVVLVYNQLFKMLKREVLLIGSVVFFVTNLILFWWLLKIQWRWAPVVFYIWVACFSVIIVNQFWSFCHDLYDPRQGKRLYGFIAAGGEIGATLGGYLSIRMSKLLGTENLLLLSAALLIPVAFITWLQNKGEVKRIREDVTQAPVVPPDTGTGGFSLILGSRYLQIVGALVVGIMVVGAFFDFEMSKLIEEEIPDKDRMTSFFGFVYGTNSLIAMVIHLLFTSWTQRTFGIQWSLLLLPIICAFEALGFLLWPTLWAVTCLEMTFRGLEYSINHTTRELLYLPLAREMKYKAKAFIDMVGYRVGDAIGAAGILLALWLFKPWMPGFGVLNLVLLAGYTWVVLAVQGRYVESLRRALALKVPDRERLTPSPASTPPEDLNALAKLYAMNLALSRTDETRDRALKEQPDLAKKIFLRLAALADPKDVWMGFELLNHASRAEARLGFEFLDNLFKLPVRGGVLRLFNRETPLEARARRGMRRFGASEADLEQYRRRLAD